MNLTKIIITFTLLSALTGCADWIYRIDVPQGNFLDQKDVDKLRIGMTKEQVLFVLGHPVVEDTFDHDTWYYVYKIKRGAKKRGKNFKKELIIEFVDNKLSLLRGDFDKAEEFDTPLDS